jgi:diaminohydroxyphosphoribosylaminopyrimidine deaminase/5-amino-6-(5-phosphoribosylamino)uracil reductase
LSLHEEFIRRCIDIAKNGLGTTRPNPMVGCVIVHNDIIIGQGFTGPYGGPHAEVNAIGSVKDKSKLKAATLYVTLEPCSHYGKTPPCCDLIMAHKIPRVVIGTTDTNVTVSGRGIEILKKSGCEVKVGVLENECMEHHRRFLTFHNKKRPYIILKWAQTGNGFIAPLTKKESKPVWITNAYSLQMVHKWRSEEQAILVGTNTILQDNPGLTVRDWTGENPIRIIIDKENKLPRTLNVFNELADTVIVSNETINFSEPIAQQICNLLYKKNINSVIIEGGAQTLQTFIDENLWDEARVFTGTVEFNDGVKAPLLRGRMIEKKQIKTDMLNIYRND